MWSPAPGRAPLLPLSASGLLAGWRHLILSAAECYCCEAVAVAGSDPAFLVPRSFPALELQNNPSASSLTVFFTPFSVSDAAAATPRMLAHRERLLARGIMVRWLRCGFCVVMFSVGWLRFVVFFLVVLGLPFIDWAGRVSNPQCSRNPPLGVADPTPVLSYEPRGLSSLALLWLSISVDEYFCM